MASTVPAIVWPINFSVPGGNPLCQGIATSAVADNAQAVQGDQRLLQLYFQTPSTATLGSASTNVQLAAGTTISIFGKATTDLEAADLLFTATGFVQLQDAAELFFYQAFLDLDTDEIGDAFTALGDGNNTLVCLADVIIVVPAQAAAAPLPAVPATTARYQVPVLLQRQVYLGTESNPSPATPTYPPAAQVAALLAAYAAGTIGGGSFAPTITSVGTNVAGSLEQVVTVGSVAGQIIKTFRGQDNILRDWTLDAGAGDNTDVSSVDADGKPNRQKPNDYNAAVPLMWNRQR